MPKPRSQETRLAHTPSEEKRSWWTKVSRIAGLDFHIIVTLLFRGWSILAGLIMLLCIPIWFTKIEQGYYYTFASLLALQIFFELGMNQVVVQVVSHEAAHLQVSKDGVLTGDAHRLDRLTSLVHLLRKWYALAAFLFALGVGSAGWYFFTRQNELPISHWLGPWLILASCNAFNLYFSPSLAIMEGFSQVGQVARLRLWQSFIGYSLTWLALVLGAGLWATPIIAGTAALCTATWLVRSGTLRNYLLRRPVINPESKIDWRVEIFPFQWRIALSWISGYMIFQLFTPMVFNKAGAIEAGKIGIALAMFNAIGSVGMSWMSAKIPTMVGHISRSDRTSLNTVFLGVAKRSMAFVLIASTIILSCIYIGQRMDYGFTARLPSMTVLMAFAAVTLTNAFIFAASAYMRAHREEPLLTASVVSAVAVTLVIYFGLRYSIEAMAVLYAAVTLCLSLPWTIILFKPYYAKTD